VVEQIERSAHSNSIDAANFGLLAGTSALNDDRPEQA
jgi:hypothetical protein